MRKYSQSLFIISIVAVSCAAPKKFERELPFATNSKSANYYELGQQITFDNLDEIRIGEQLQTNQENDYRKGLLTNKDTSSFESRINIVARKGALSATAYFSHRTVYEVKTPTTFATLFPNEDNRHTTLAHRLLFAKEYKEGKEKVVPRELTYAGTIQLSNGKTWKMLARGEKDKPVNRYVLSSNERRIVVQPWWQRFQGRKRTNGIEFFVDGAKVAAATNGGTAGTLWFASHIDPETELVITALMVGIRKLYPSIAPTLPKSIWDEKW